jgi:Raf kinase inhibitor-like YbhB/YbcL family protein
MALSVLAMPAMADDDHKHPRFTLSSPDLASGEFANHFVLNGFGCAGDNVSPELVWKNPPAGTQSFALQLYDPDAPTGSGFWHWAVYNIPATATGLAQGAGNSPATLPPGAYGGNTDFMDTGATGGAAATAAPPPVGDHTATSSRCCLAVPSVQAAGGILAAEARRCMASC